MSVVKIIFTVALVNAAFGQATALECYVCRGCATVGPEHIQTCASDTTDDPVTDSDTIFIREEVHVADVPWLEETETIVEDKEKSYVLVDSQLPGAEHFSSRSLKQAAGVEDDRCVLSLFLENGATNVVRACSTASDDDNLRCSQAVADNFTGEVQYCRLCDEDLCNSSTKSTVGVVVMIAVAFSYFVV